jgi:hypothetical protein
MIVLVLGFSMHVQAQAEVQASGLRVSGEKATALLNVLVDVGSKMECGSGKCGTTITDISCVDNHVHPNECRLSVQTESGVSKTVSLAGAHTEAFVASLELATEADLQNCSSEECSVKLKSVDCLIPPGELDYAMQAYCTVTK